MKCYRLILGEAVPDPPNSARLVELRIMSSLWTLYDAVVNSTLAFSIIRMRNAQLSVLVWNVI